MTVCAFPYRRTATNPAASSTSATHNTESAPSSGAASRAAFNRMTSPSAIRCSPTTSTVSRRSARAGVLRRHTVEVVGEQRMADGEIIPLDEARLAAPLDGALSVLWVALVLLAAGVVAVRL